VSVKKKSSGTNRKLNTFGGVFTPSLLTILGVIMYLRFGWVVGNVGLIGTLIIVTLSTSITFLTSLSIASIATNSPVKAGGAYFMISRSLGIEVGGSIGVPLYLAQAFSVALYVAGFAESLVAVFPVLDIRWVGVVTTLLLGTMALFSTKATIRIQYVILAIIGISLLSLIMGKPLEESHVEMWGVPASRSVGFWKVFAIFFPAVTGIMAGVNLSGDLKHPSRAIPRGTFLAVGTGYLIYMLLPVLLASRADASTLVSDPLIMRRIAFWGDAILLGVWGATLSSAVGSLLGAPRVLQVLAEDHVLPKPFAFFAKGNGPEQIPRAATVFTIVITMISVYFGSLNIIAPVLTMFFLTTYGVLNITAGVERFLKSPSFRPEFKVHWIFSLLGAIGCASVMILINATANTVAFFFIILIFIWLKRRKIKSAFGDVRRGVFQTIIRYALLQLTRDEHAKSWRPHLLVLSGAPTKRWRLIGLANDLSQEKTLFTVVTILSGEKVGPGKVKDYEKQISNYLYTRKVNALVRVTRASDPFTGAQQLVDSYGLGKLVPNTILLGDTREAQHHEPYAEMIRHFYKAKRNVIIFQDDEAHQRFKKKTLDIWWGGLNENGSLMMILGYLLQNSPKWRNVRITIKMMVNKEEAAGKARENLTKLLSGMRFQFSTNVLVANGESFWSVLKRESAATDLVMLGLNKPGNDFTDYYDKLKQNTRDIKTKIFVLAAQDVSFKEVLM